MSGRVARIVLCAAGPLENWLSPPCSAWWIHSSEKRSAESLCIASSAADFVPRAGCTPPGQHLLLHPHHPVAERVVRQELAEVRQPAPEEALVLVDRVLGHREAAHDHETAAADRAPRRPRAPDRRRRDDRRARASMASRGMSRDALEDLLEPGDRRAASSRYTRSSSLGEVGADPRHRVVHLLGVDRRAHARSLHRNGAQPRRVRAGGLGHEAGVGAGAHEAQTRARRTRSSSSRSRMPAMPKIGVVRAARLGHRAHRVEERLVAELAEDPHLGGEVVRADHHHVDARHRRDLVGARDRVGRLEHHRHRSSARRRGRAAPAAASAGSGSPGSVRTTDRWPRGGKRHASTIGSASRAGLDVRDDHAHRADVERAGEVLVVVRRAPARAA